MRTLVIAILPGYTLVIALCQDAIFIAMHRHFPLHTSIHCAVFVISIAFSLLRMLYEYISIYAAVFGSGICHDCQ